MTSTDSLSQAKDIFGTLATAMVTPFTASGAVDYAGAEALADYLVRQGNDSLVVSGTTGETSTLEDSEKEDLFRAVVSAVGGRARVIAGTGTNHTSHSIEMAHRAVKAGVDGQLVVTPYYNKPTQSGVIGHVKAVAQATELPIMLYDIPGRAGIPMRTSTLIELAGVDTVLALKDAKGDIAATSEVICKTDLAVYSGEDALTLPLISVGAVGVVSVTAHVAAPLFRRMIDSALAGDYAAAREAHCELEPVVRAVMTHIPGVMAAKALLARAGVLAREDVRLPLVTASEAELAPVLAAMAESSWEIPADNGSRQK
ncbi:4-hydroxy-tetrahydrodipicolinate synthase [Falsarthrobacter nasiphocae]|uniref:4-hydroxy-tetrahydrodipicolinate synthase n=1 Tax=Falsarthrobacter nasiphocae TaxID=189863 RepID=A0AAE3YJ43_9MICC|nr:4-hydroxy-tetrahydrodipicolinate synthase [Falsarthrobacter nasiphocae]MDR6892666.1 4-hydroxy-tetrahydrodipicolinate synthase [Falsarthrobacter nasiphocae]